MSARIKYSIDKNTKLHSGGSRIFLRGRQLKKRMWYLIILQIFAENCMKIKEFGVSGSPFGSAYATKRTS